jgi:transposase
VEEEVLAAIWGRDKDAEISRLKRELNRVTEERDILKKATAYFARDAK